MFTQHRERIASRASKRGVRARKFIRQNLTSTATIAIIVGSVAGAHLWAPYGALSQNVGPRLSPPSSDHLFGTDSLGRDVLSRVLYAGQVTLPAAAVVVIVGFVVGTVLGLIAGLAGGVVDDLIMRLTDIFLAFPVIILAMVVAAALGSGLENGVIALTIVWWPQYTRVARTLVIESRDREYVLASRAAGANRRWLLFKVIMPNVMTLLVTMAAFDVGRAILNFAVLGFLGLGARPPAPEWGSMIADGSTVLASWWIATFPALVVLLLTLAFNFLGDSVRDVLNPASAMSRVRSR